MIRAPSTSSYRPCSPSSPSSSSGAVSHHGGGAWHAKWQSCVGSLHALAHGLRPDAICLCERRMPCGHTCIRAAHVAGGDFGCICSRCGDSRASRIADEELHRWRSLRDALNIHAKQFDVPEPADKAAAAAADATASGAADDAAAAEGGGVTSEQQAMGSLQAAKAAARAKIAARPPSPLYGVPYLSRLSRKHQRARERDASPVPPPRRKDRAAAGAAAGEEAAAGAAAEVAAEEAPAGQAASPVFEPASPTFDPREISPSYDGEAEEDMGGGRGGGGGGASRSARAGKAPRSTRAAPKEARASSRKGAEARAKAAVEALDPLDPLDPPPGWELHQSKRHRKSFWFHKETKQRVWKLEHCHTRPGERGEEKGGSRKRKGNGDADERGGSSGSGGRKRR